MESIPVSFEYKDQQYNGTLSKVAGAGSGGMYHLTVNKMFWGTLWYVEGNPGFNGGLHAVPAGWRFASNTYTELSALAEEFGKAVAAL